MMKNINKKIYKLTSSKMQNCIHSLWQVLETRLRCVDEYLDMFRGFLESLTLTMT